MRERERLQQTVVAMTVGETVAAAAVEGTQWEAASVVAEVAKTAVAMMVGLMAMVAAADTLGRRLPKKIRKNIYGELGANL